MDLIAVKDYPRNAYTTYWEIGIDTTTFRWFARIYDWSTNEVQATRTGSAASVIDARTASQLWVKSQMEQFKRH